jgi:hypothetical protein
MPEIGGMSVLRVDGKFTAGRQNDVKTESGL